MKLFFILTLLVSSMAFAAETKTTTAEDGHDKEHQHVTKEKIDHDHDQNHHKAHDHKAHHPEHVENQKKKTR